MPGPWVNIALIIVLTFFPALLTNMVLGVGRLVSVVGVWFLISARP